MVNDETMDGEEKLAAIIVTCLTSLEITALLKCVDGALYGVTITAISGVIFWLQRRKYRKRK
jgi:hypothetical protein